MSEDPLGEQGGANTYRMVSNSPLASIDHDGLIPQGPKCCKKPKTSWSDIGEAIWTAAGYVVTGSEIPGAAMGAPDIAKIAIIEKFKEACADCLGELPPDPCGCPICAEYEKVKSKLDP